MRVAVAIAIGAGVLGPAVPALAYNEDGHFYTVLAALRDRAPAFAGQERAEAIVTAFCAQMPDLARELDAVTLRVSIAGSASGWAWGVIGTCWSQGVRHMTTAHELIHALTGSRPQPVTDAAVAIIQSLRKGRLSQEFDPVRACAIGFGVHLLGDSFAHRQIGEEDSYTYPPGMGHWRDKHNPDFIAFTKERTQLWFQYLQALSQALDLNVNDAAIKALQKIAIDNLNPPQDETYNTTTIIRELAATAGVAEPGVEALGLPNGPPGPAAIEKYNDSPSLWDSYVLQHSFDEVVSAYLPYLPPGTEEQLNYKAVWNLYMPLAIREFTQRQVPMACTPEDKIE